MRLVTWIENCHVVARRGAAGARGRHAPQARCHVRAREARECTWLARAEARALSREVKEVARAAGALRRVVTWLEHAEGPRFQNQISQPMLSYQKIDI